ncbi:MAG: dockerin type I repeat-containing protein, partial [Firmicutes bacterium]|nr:dockerin type I repeat-containing protein [Bacillota bacterium]
EDDSSKTETGKTEEKKEEKQTPPSPVVPTATSDKYTLGESITGVSSGTTASALLEGLTIANGNAKVFDASGNEIASDSLASTNVGTGATVKVYDSDGVEKLRYYVIIRGDNNGDGKVNSADALRTQRHSVGTLALSGPSLTASDINGDGKYNSADALLMQRFSVGTYSISW